MSLPENSKPPKSKNTINILLATAAGQVGCLTLIIVIAAVLGGMALDAKLGTKPWFTLGLLVVSIPISLVLMFFIVRKTTSKMKISGKDGSDHEEGSIGKDA